MIEIKIWGNSDGLQEFYTSRISDSFMSWPSRILSWDPYTSIPWKKNGLQFYSLTQIKECLIFTSFLTINDSFGRGQGILATSILLRQNSKIENFSNFDLLIELTNLSKSLCLKDKNKVDINTVNWSLFDDLLNQCKINKMVYSDSTILDENSTRKGFIEYKSELDLRDFINNPFRKAYKVFKEIYFVPILDLNNLIDRQLFNKTQLTDLTQHVPPREKSYKVQINFKASQIGVILPLLEEKHIDLGVNHHKYIDFRVNHHKCDLNTEVYNGDEITVVVNHPKCEDFNKSYKIGEELILNDKIILDIALTLRPRIIEIIIVKEVDQASIHGLVIELSKNGKSKTVRANNEGKYVEEIPYNETFYYKVSSTDYKTEKGTIDFFSKDQLDIVLDRKEPIPINNPRTDPFDKNSSEVKVTSDKDQNEGETKKSDWKKNIVNIGEDRKTLFIIGALIAILLIVLTIIYNLDLIEPEPNPIDNKVINETSHTKLQNSVDSSVDSLIVDSIEISKLKIPNDSIKIENFYSKYSNHYLESLKNNSNLILVKLFSSNRDTIGILKARIDEYKKQVINRNLTVVQSQIKLTRAQKKLFHEIVAIIELTKGKNSNNGNKLLKTLREILHKENLDENEKSYYQTRFNALLKVFTLIEGCRNANDPNGCLKTVNTPTYNNNLSIPQQKYLKDSFEIFKELVIQNHK